MNRIVADGLADLIAVPDICPNLSEAGLCPGLDNNQSSIYLHRTQVLTLLRRSGLNGLENSKLLMPNSGNIRENPLE
jgi:hypothetical protein